MTNGVERPKFELGELNLDELKLQPGDHVVLKQDWSSGTEEPSPPLPPPAPPPGVIAVTSERALAAEERSQPRRLGNPVAWWRRQQRLWRERRELERATPRFVDLAAVPFVTQHDRAFVDEAQQRGFLVRQLARPTPIDWTAPLLGELAGDGIVRISGTAKRLSDGVTRTRLEMVRNKQRTSIERREAWEFPPDERQRAALWDVEHVLAELPPNGREHLWLVTTTILLSHEQPAGLAALEERVRLYLEDLQLPYLPTSGEHGWAVVESLPIGRTQIGKRFPTTTTGLVFTLPQPEELSMTGPRCIYWGRRLPSQKPVFIDHRNHKEGPETGNVGFLTPSGNGKSFVKKHLILEYATLPLQDQPRITVIDPEGEYGRIRARFGTRAQHLPFVVGGDLAINVMDLPPAFTDERGRRVNPVIEQTTVAAGLISRLVHPDEQERASVLEAITSAYASVGILEDEPSSWTKPVPTLTAVYQQLLKTEPSVAKRLAPYARDDRAQGGTRGTYAAMFASPTNVSFSSAFTHVDLSGLGATERGGPFGAAVAYLIAIGFWREVLLHPGWYLCDLDELGELLADDYMAGVFASMFVRARKYGLQLFAATQYLSDLTRSNEGRRILGAMGSVFLMKQEGGENREAVARQWPQLTPSDLDWLVAEAGRGYGILITRRGRRARLYVDVQDPGPESPERRNSEYGLCTTDVNDLEAMGLR